MSNKCNILDILLKINEKNGCKIDASVIEECLSIQKTHQYDKDRNTAKIIKSIIEEVVAKKEGDLI